MTRKLFIAAALLLASLNFAAAMTRAGAPAKFSIPFASSAGANYITYPLPTASQIGIKNCAASLTDGEPPLTMQSAASGGCAPFGQDFNGILKQITQWNQQTGMGAAPAYDSAFSSSISGYPEGSILSQASNPSCFWISQSDNNVTDPDTGGAGWTSACPGGGIGGTSTGSANAQAVTTTPFALTSLSRVCFLAGYTNTGSLQLNVNSAGAVNVEQRTQAGLALLVGGEVHVGMVTCVEWDGTQWELDTFATNASLVAADQSLSGGANVTSDNLGTFSTGTLTVDCGARPLQYLVNAGTFTIAAPSNDGSCVLKMTNTTGAQVPTFSGFTVNSNTGEPITTTSGNVFFISIWRIGGVSSYLVKSAQ